MKLKSLRCTLPIAAMTAFSLMLSACGSDDDTSNAKATSSAPAASSASSSAAQSSSEPASASTSASVAESTAPVDDGKKVEITFSFVPEGNGEAIAKGIIKAFEAKHPNITVKPEVRLGDDGGHNLVKTRLATGEMSDVFSHNSGAVLQSLSPAKTLVPLTGDPYLANVEDAFLAAVKTGDDVYGVPYGSAMGGGIFYNKKVYEKLGLQVPKTWDEFMKNNEKIKAAGVEPVVQTYQDAWTAQMLVLADFHNVAAANPDFVTGYTGNKIKYATDPAAIKGFQRLEALHKAGFINKDAASIKYEDGLRRVATGEAAHYPMLTFALASIGANNKDNLQDVGFFAQPGDDAAKNGLTLWLPGGAYIPTTTTGDKLEAAKKFLAFIASKEGCDAQNAVQAPTGPYVVKGCTLPETVPGAVKDMQAYLDSGAVSPALEFLSPIKGTALDMLTVEVGAGIKSAAEAASFYDKDVVKQAKQLGLPGW